MSTNNRNPRAVLGERQLTKAWGISEETANKILEVCKMKLAELKKFAEKENIKVPYYCKKKDYILWIVCQLSNSKDVETTASSCFVHDRYVETNHGFSFVHGTYISEYASYIYTGNLSDITLLWDIDKDKLLWISYLDWIEAKNQEVAKICKANHCGENLKPH